LNEQNIPAGNQPQTTPKKIFDTIDGNTLMLQEYEPLQFAVEKILPHGLFIMAGSGKIGKSWLSLDIGTAVATGGKLWDFAAEQGEVLYLGSRRYPSAVTGQAGENRNRRCKYITASSHDRRAWNRQRAD